MDEGSKNFKRGCTQSAALFFLMLALSGTRSISAETVDSAVWLEAFNFLRSTEQDKELLQLRNVALKYNPSSLPLAEAFLEFYISQKQRGALDEYFEALVESNQCSSPKTPRPEQRESASVCASLKKIWRERLSSLLFYDASAAFLEKARRALEAEDCREAQAALKEVEAREGRFYYLSEQKLRLAICLKDLAAQEQLEVELENLRF